MCAYKENQIQAHDQGGDVDMQLSRDRLLLGGSQRLDCMAVRVHEAQRGICILLIDRVLLLSGGQLWCFADSHGLLLVVAHFEGEIRTAAS